MDEFQDVSQPQVDFISVLRGRYIPNRAVSHVTIVGDPRQTIFEWRGARPEVLLQKRASPRSQSFDLTENFRSGQKIVELANIIIEQVLPELPPVKSAHRGRTRRPPVEEDARGDAQRSGRPGSALDRQRDS